MPDLTRERVEEFLKYFIHECNKQNYSIFIHKLLTDWLTLEARVRELEAANTRLTKLTKMQDEFITEKSGLAAERLAEVNRLAFELQQALKDGLEEETHG